MPQTPKSISVPLAGAAATAYTVPGGATAVLKTALGQNVVGGSSGFTVQKLSSGVYSPLIIEQTSQITNATGGTPFNSRNLIDGPVTLSAGDSIVVSDSATPQWKFARSSAFSSSIVNTYTPRNLLFSNGVYIMVASDSTNVSSLVQRSTDGVNWTEIATGNVLGTANAYYMANRGNNWVVGRWNTIDYMYSTDNGLTWTAAALPSGALIQSVAANSTTFVFCTALGVYTSTTLPTWTLSTALNNLINISYSSSSNSAYIPQVASWDGTYWFIANYYGTWYTTDFTTYKTLYGPVGGSSQPSSFLGLRWSSVYSRYYAIGKSHNNAQDVISSSTNGFDWTPTSTGTNLFGGNSNGRVNSAGSNSVLIAKNNNGTVNVLKSTDGTNWSSATIVRANFIGMVEGLANGVFVTCRDSTGEFFMSTDPTTSSGTLFSSAVGGNSNFHAAASDGTGWVLFNYDNAVSYQKCAYGPNATTMTSGAVNVDTSGEYYTNLVWWPARGVYVAVGQNGSIRTSTNGASWTNISFNISQSLVANASVQVIGNFLYVVNYNTGSSIYRTSVADSATSSWVFTQIPITTFAYNDYANGYYTASMAYPDKYTSGGMASNGTDIVLSNQQGNAWIYTPSVGPFIRTPGAGGIIVERVNNLDIAYTGITGAGVSTRGFFYGSDIVSSLPTNSTFISTNFSQTLTNGPGGNPLLSGTKVLFYGGAYYAVSDSNAIAYATNIRSFTNYTWSSTSIGLVPVVLASSSNGTQNRIQSDGTNFISYSSSTSRQGVFSSTSPVNSLASSTITLGLIEIT